MQTFADMHTSSPSTKTVNPSSPFRVPPDHNYQRKVSISHNLSKTIHSAQRRSSIIAEFWPVVHNLHNQEPVSYLKGMVALCRQIFPAHLQHTILPPTIFYDLCQIPAIFTHNTDILTSIWVFQLCIAVHVLSLKPGVTCAQSSLSTEVNKSALKSLKHIS